MSLKSTRRNTLATLILSAGLVTGCATEYNLAKQEESQDYSVRLLGTATVLLQYGDLTIVTDPAFDPAGGTYPLGASTLEKTAGPAVLSNDLGDVDLVLLSHDQHADNLDTSGRALLADAELTLTTTEGGERLGDLAQGLAWWDTYKVGDVTITAVPAQHGPEQAVAMIGTVNGFVISSDTGPTIYISGDTVPFSGTDEIVERMAGEIDYALLHGGSVARGEEKLTYFTMTADDVVTLATKLDLEQFSLIHADSWKHFREPMPAALSVVAASDIANRHLDLSDNKTKVLNLSAN